MATAPKMNNLRPQPRPGAYPATPPPAASNDPWWLSLIQGQMGQNGQGLSGDFNHDGTVDIQDFSWAMANNPAAPPPSLSPGGGTAGMTLQPSQPSGGYNTMNLPLQSRKPMGAPGSIGAMPPPSFGNVDMGLGGGVNATPGGGMGGGPPQPGQGPSIGDFFGMRPAPTDPSQINPMMRKKRPGMNPGGYGQGY